MDKQLLKEIIIEQKSALDAEGTGVARSGLQEVKKYFTLNGLRKFLGLGSANTAKAYVDYLENSFLFFSLNVYSPSIKKHLVANKKIYCADNGLADAVAFRFSEDRGKYLENAVFLELKRRKADVYYYKTKNNLEVDFLSKKGIKPAELIQVCWSLKDKKTKEREIKSLSRAMDELKLKNGLILTDNEDEVIKIKGETVIIKSVYRWLLRG